MKETEVGMIPEDWEVISIGSVSNVYTGGEAPIDYSKVKNDVYKFPIYSNGRAIYGFSKSFIINKDSVCISSIGENTGDVFYYAKDFTPIIRLKVIVPTSNKINTKCLFYFLSKYRIDTTKNGGIPNINSDDVRNLKTPFPKSLPEQQKIAAALSDIDSLISSLEEQIQKKKNIKQGAMQQLLTGKRRLPGFAKSNKTKQTELGEIPEDWEVKELNDFCYLITKQTGFDYTNEIKDSLVLSNGKDVLPFIQNKDFCGFEINYNTDYFIPSNIANKYPKIKLDEKVLLISLSGRIGNVASFNHKQDAFIGGAVGIARFRDLNNIDWCTLYLLSNIGQRQIFANEKSGAQHNLTVEDVRNLKIAFPSKEEQSAIAKILSDMDTEINELESKLSKYRELKTGMMQQLLTGKIRLVRS